MGYLRNEEGIKTFGTKVRAARQSKGWTQLQLAMEADVEIMHVSKIERGIINTSLSHILNLARALQVDPGILLAEPEEDKT